MEDPLPNPSSEHPEVSIATQKAWEVHMHLRQYEDCEPDSLQAQMAAEQSALAFESLMDEVHDTFTGYVQHATMGNYTDAEDVAAEARYRIFKGLRTFRGDAEVTTWMFRIVKNVAITHYGRKKRYAKTFSLPGDDVLANLDFNAPSIDDPDSTVLLKERHEEARQTVERALSELTPTNRKIAYWFFAQGISQAEIGRRLGIAESVVKVRAHRAKKKLGEIILRDKPEIEQP